MTQAPPSFGRFLTSTWSLWHAGSAFWRSTYPGTSDGMATIVSIGIDLAMHGQPHRLGVSPCPRGRKGQEKISGKRNLSEKTRRRRNSPMNSPWSKRNTSIERNLQTSYWYNMFIRVVEESKWLNVTRSVSSYRVWAWRSRDECPPATFGSPCEIGQIRLQSGKEIPWMEPILYFHQVSYWNRRKISNRIEGNRRGSGTAMEM